MNALHAIRSGLVLVLIAAGLTALRWHSARFEYIPTRQFRVDGRHL